MTLESVPGGSTRPPNSIALRGLAAHKATRRLEVKVDNTFSAAKNIELLFNSYAPLGYMLPWEALDYIELLATYNPDYSQAVDNIRTLANSGHNLFIEAGSQLEQNRIKELLEEKARLVQENHGGIDGLIDKLLDQAATYGAMCGEWILNDDLTDVIDFVDINPKDIRFYRDTEEGPWEAYQKVSTKQAMRAIERGQSVLNVEYVKLNPLTFRYYAFDAAPGSPYGTPPFVAALASINIQRDMVHNMAQIVKKLGLLGIVDMSIQFPPKIAGETDDAYEARIAQYLDDYVGAVEDMAKDGGLVHFDDVEIKTYTLSGNAAGATNIFKQNEEQVFSGLKSMPSVQGRSYSTTETYAGVAYDIIIRNTLKYQRAVKRMIEAGYWLIATLNGRKPQKIEISFRSNKTLQRLQNAQAEEKEIANALKYWVTGMVDQIGFAQMLGFSQPKVKYELPPESPIIGNGQATLPPEDDEEEPSEDERGEEEVDTDEEERS